VLWAAGPKTQGSHGELSGGEGGRALKEFEGALLGGVDHGRITQTTNPILGDRTTSLRHSARSYPSHSRRPPDLFVGAWIQYRRGGSFGA
jgi:hypothetical protein